MTLRDIWRAWDTTDERCNKYLNDKLQQAPRGLEQGHRPGHLPKSGLLDPDPGLPQSLVHQQDQILIQNLDFHAWGRLIFLSHTE